jgi:calcium/calmodulin-dependent protein kinase I
MEQLDQAKVIDTRIRDVSERYAVGDILGEGRFSQVFAASRGGKSCALKVVDAGTLEEDEEAVEALVQEVTALRKAYAASSSHVPRVHEVLATDDNVYVVMDQVRGCELFEMLEQGPLGESSARRLVAQLLSALASLHARHVVHRDVKPENLMVCDVDDPSKCRLVMIDFGYASVGSSDKLEGLAGSPEYAAPEVLAWLDGDAQPYGKACDMWSVGVTAYVLLTGELPFDFPDEGGLEEHVRTAKPKFSQKCWADKETAAAKEFVLECMRVNPAKRLTAQQALRHRWFSPRADDSQGVAIGASRRFSHVLERRVAGLAVSNAPRRVIRWFGRVAKGKGATSHASPSRQAFWELKLGMPPTPVEQEASSGSSPIRVDIRVHSSPPSASASPSQAPNISPQRQLSMQFKAMGKSPLVTLPLATLNTQQQQQQQPDLARIMNSARKSVALDSDRAEEARIKAATPRHIVAAATAMDSENPLPSPRRALVLAPSPRSTDDLPWRIELPGSLPRGIPGMPPPPQEQKKPFKVLLPQTEMGA